MARGWWDRPAICPFLSSVAEGRTLEGSSQWVWASFPLLLFVIGQDFSRRHHFCVQRAEGNRISLCKINSLFSWWQNLHMCKFFCHHTGRRPWELPGKKNTKNHLCLFSKYLMNILVPICREREWWHLLIAIHLGQDEAEPPAATAYSHYFLSGSLFCVK